MHLDFPAIKKIPIVEVCARLGIRLRYRGEYANGPCPLPTHPADDKNNKSFSVHVPSNTWRCFHTEVIGNIYENPELLKA
jgi:YopX protein